jgi:hypothetical protein
MSLLFCDGFEWIGAAVSEANVETALKFFYSNADVGTNGLSTSRGSLRGPDLTSTTHFLLPRKLQQPDGNTTLIFGFYMKTPGSWFNGGDLWRVVCGDSTQCLFDINSADDTINFKRGATTLGTSTYALTVNTEFYIEIKIVISDGTGGSMEMKAIDLTSAADDDAATASEWTISGVDTRNSTSASETAWDTIQFIHAGISGSTIYDDIYICNGAGTDNNDFLGNTYVETLEPDGAGNSTQLTPSAGSNYQNVDENDPDGDTTYNLADADGETDLYTTSNPTKSGDPFAVVVQAIARTTDADRRTLRLPIRNNSVDSEGSDFVLLDNTYRGRTRVLETDANGDPWTNSLVNGLEIGFKRQANT